MSVQRAIQIQAPRVAKLVADAPIPALRPGYVRVKTAAVALNPTDWKSIDGRAAAGATVGCDYAGVVEAVGPDVHTGVRVGDRVAGVTHGSNQSNHFDGAFAEHIAAKAALQSKIPDSLSFEEAATLGLGITTVAQGLYQYLRLPWPGKEAEGKQEFSVLVYGGSTATGTLAIQFAKMSGATVVTTCSPRNFELVRGLGADQVFDYNAPDVGKEIREATGDELEYAFDCVSSEATAKICADALSSKGGKYNALLRTKVAREDVESSMTSAYTAFGEDFQKGEMKWTGDAEHLEYAGKFWKLAGELLAQGKIKVHPPQVREGGLEGVLSGLDDMRNDRVSGVKLVYRV